MTKNQKLFSSRLLCDHDTGILTWKPRVVIKPTDKTWNKKFAGKAINSLHKIGHISYIRLRIDDKPFYAHRIIWEMTHGYAPNIIDHINGDGMDNRLCNLRNVSSSLNARNARKRSDNTSGLTGVWWSKEKRKWVAEVGTKKYGYFENKEDAHNKCLSVRESLSFHSNHGNVR